MKITNICGVLLLSFTQTFTIVADEGFEIDDFREHADLSESFEPFEQARLKVEPWVYGYASAFPHDIRLLERTTGKQWPFFLQKYVSEPPTERTATVINEGWVASDIGYLEFEVVIPEHDGWHHQLEVSVSGRDYVRRVEVYSAPVSMAERALLNSGYLINECSRTGKWISSDRIRYPKTDHQRLYLRVYENAKGKDAPFEVNSVKVQFNRQTMGTPELEIVDFVYDEVDSNDPDRKESQVLILDKGESQRQIKAISIEVADHSFVRNVWVYGRNHPNDSWRWVGSEAIHLTPAGQKSRIELKSRRSDYRYLKLVVRHGDDQPLAVDSIKLWAHVEYLVFEARSKGKTTLCVGNSTLSAPYYDLEKRISQKSIASLKVVSTDFDHASYRHPSTPFTVPYGKLLSIVAVAVVGALILWIVVSMSKKIQDEESEE